VLWDPSEQPVGACTVRELPGQVLFTLGTTGSASCRYTTGPAFDLSGDGIWARVPLRTGFDPSLVVALEAVDLDGNAIKFSLQNNWLRGSIQGTAIPGSIEALEFWRFRESNGLILFDTSNDGVAWSPALTLANTTVDASAVHISFGVGTATALTREHLVYLNSVNTP
jgi:hypothetical protein